MSSDPGGIGGRLFDACFGLLLAALALYCAARLIEAVLPTLMVVLGGLALLGLFFGVVIAVRRLRERW